MVSVPTITTVCRQWAKERGLRHELNDKWQHVFYLHDGIQFGIHDKRLEVIVAVRANRESMTVAVRSLLDELHGKCLMREPTWGQARSMLRLQATPDSGLATSAPMVRTPSVVPGVTLEVMLDSPRTKTFVRVEMLGKWKQSVETVIAVARRNTETLLRPQLPVPRIPELAFYCLHGDYASMAIELPLPVLLAGVDSLQDGYDFSIPTAENLLVLPRANATDGDRFALMMMTKQILIGAKRFERAGIGSRSSDPANNKWFNPWTFPSASS